MKLYSRPAGWLNRGGGKLHGHFASPTRLARGSPTSLTTVGIRDRVRNVSPVQGLPAHQGTHSFEFGVRLLTISHPRSMNFTSTRSRRSFSQTSSRNGGVAVFSRDGDRSRVQRNHLGISRIMLLPAIRSSASFNGPLS